MQRLPSFHLHSPPKGSKAKLHWIILSMNIGSLKLHYSNGFKSTINRSVSLLSSTAGSYFHCKCKHNDINTSHTCDKSLGSGDPVDLEVCCVEHVISIVGSDWHWNHYRVFQLVYSSFLSLCSSAEICLVETRDATLTFCSTVSENIWF